MKPKVIALLQARTDSTRLPKKVLKNILDKPMIIHQLLRTSKSKLIDKLILLTSDENSDDELYKVIIDNNFSIFRGDKNNVLKRFYDSVSDLKLNDNDLIVRLTGDCPLHDANIIDESIVAFIKGKCDYLANCIKPIYPDGLDVEIFTYNSLKVAYNNATLKSELEHVTPYIRNNKKLIIKDLNKKPIYNNWRLTVDEENDFLLISKIYDYFNTTYFSFEDTVKFLENNKELLKINNSINRNEGYAKSIKEDNNDK
jgi:spore coat polysaccharide biosynthesis protein SpsF